MKHKLLALLLAALMLTLPGCRLAREPSEQQGENSTLAQARFMGVYVVREDWNAQPDRTHWVEYGSTQIDTDYGTFDFPTEILIGQYDEDSHTITFPGLEGRALFAMRGTAEDGHTYDMMISDMCGGHFHSIVNDAGESYEVSGTLYFGPPIDDPDYYPGDDPRVWHCYNVFQMADGTVYLDGSGDSYSGPGGMGATQTATYTTTVNGEAMEYYTKSEVWIEYVERLTVLTVRQYSADGQLLQTTELPVQGELPVVEWLADAAWAVVEELRGGDVIRTAYDRPGEDGNPVSHPVILLDDEGLGYEESVKFE